MTWNTDRSRILDYQNCPRKRFYSHHYNGTGIQRLSKSLPLVFGSAFHEGVEVLLESPGISLMTNPPTTAVDVAVRRASDYLDKAFEAKSVDLDDPNSAYAISEQKAIAEGLLRGWWLYEGSQFLEQFEVLEVETEGRADMGDGITLLFRPDAVVRERSSGDVYVISWKTEAIHGQHSMNRATTDMQSMSEVWGITKTRGERVEGVLYRWAVKGLRRHDDYLGFKVQDTPLAYGWLRGEPNDPEADWSWKYKWQTEEINPKTGRPAQTQLPKGYRKVPVWNHYPGGVKAWVEALSQRDIQPRHLNALEGVFPQSLPVSRRADEIESWRRQITAQEDRIRDSVFYLKGEGIDSEFPQHTARCFDYASRCPFYDACFTPAVNADPLASGLYTIRTANHPEKEEEE